MKLVAVTMRQDVVTARQETVDALDIRWMDFLLRCGLAALPLPNCETTASRLLEHTLPDAVLLTGGGEPTSICGEMRPRDKVEALAIVWAQRMGRPVVGVCRGMQTLLARDGVHWRAVDGHVAVKHAVMGTLAREVNSFHRYAATGEAGPWTVLARAPDGVIEAAEDPERRLAAVMWHPERASPFDDRDIDLFVRWLASAPQQPRTQSHAGASSTSSP